VYIRTVANPTLNVWTTRPTSAWSPATFVRIPTDIMGIWYQNLFGLPDQAHPLYSGVLGHSGRGRPTPIQDLLLVPVNVNNIHLLVNAPVSLVPTLSVPNARRLSLRIHSPSNLSVRWVLLPGRRTQALTETEKTVGSPILTSSPPRTPTHSMESPVQTPKTLRNRFPTPRRTRIIPSMESSLAGAMALELNGWMGC